MPQVETNAAEVKSLSKLLKRTVVSADRIAGGRNNRVYLVSCGPDDRYVAKFYADDLPGDKNRLEAEFTGLRFLWAHGVRCIPRPVAEDPRLRCAIYEFVDGEKILPTEVTAIDVDQAIKFLMQLKDLRAEAVGAQLPAAAEACFSICQVFDSVQRRIDGLLSLESTESQYLDLHAFLISELVPCWEQARVWSQVAAESWSISLAKEISPEERTLSPSDFGFHNALRRKDGQLVFLDFEYFGWDDPAKTIADFLLHPGMDLDKTLMERFRHGVVQGFPELPDLARRVRVLYPLFGLKWCIILLNAFLPRYLTARSFLSCDGPGALQKMQLAKARSLLHRVVREHQGFAA